MRSKSGFFKLEDLKPYIPRHKNRSQWMLKEVILRACYKWLLKLKVYPWWEAIKCVHRSQSNFFFFQSQRAWEHENIWTVPLTRCSIRFVAPPKTWDALMLHWQQQLLCRWWKETGADGEQSTGYVVPSLSNVVPEDPIRSRLMTAGGESGSWVQLRSPALSSRKQDKQWNWR